MLVHLLYRMIISPIEYMLEIVFRLLLHFFTIKTSLIGMSIVVSLLCLPLYIRADAIQQEEHDKQKAMEKWLKHIRSTFSGDERLMMTNTYYRQQNYRPASALKGTLSLLLQIPFFLAAYHFLSHLEIFQGASAFGIADLSQPDALLKLGPLSVNILPVLMTCINLVSGAVYTKGHPLREKLQIYILAAFFLVFLYQSPAALVIYWTMNNLFSLFKNIVTKYSKDSKRVLYLFLSLLGILFVLHALIKGKYRQSALLDEYGWLAFGILLPVVCQFPLLHSLTIKQKTRSAAATPTPAVPHWPFAIALALFQGVLIPLSVISSSAQDFVNIYHYVNPLHYVLTGAFIACGLYVVWGSVFYYLLPAAKRRTG
ncbi:MAG: membrane protein insertase YidC, partial [Lachnospiraceae bacterium]|nr:membrane protein insertase YidC [Lachnospiraceae bacterium]